MLHPGAAVLHLDVGEGAGAAGLADEHGVALAEVAGALGLGLHLHQAAVAVGAVAGADALADDGALGVPADVDHLGAGVGLLLVVGEGHAVELAHAVIAHQQAAGVLPGDGAAGLHLGPADARGDALAEAALGDEVEDAAQAVLVAGVPVLHGAVLDGGPVQGHQLHHRRMQLVGVELGGGAALQVAHAGAGLGHNEGALELARVLVVDAEVGAQVHGTGDALGDEHEAAICEHGAVEGRVEVVGEGHHAAEVLLDEVGVFPHGLAEAAEDDSLGGELLFVGGGDAHGVEDHVHGHARQGRLLVDGYAQLFKGAFQLRVHLVHGGVLGDLLLGGAVVDDALEVGPGVSHIGPVGLRQGQPVAVGLQAEVEQPLGFTLLGRDEPDRVLVQSGRSAVRFDVRHEAVLVFLAGDHIEGGTHARLPIPSSVESRLNLST